MAKRKSKGAYMLSRFAGVSEAVAEREPAGEILTLSVAKWKEPYG